MAIKLKVKHRAKFDDEFIKEVQLAMLARHKELKRQLSYTRVPVLQKQASVTARYLTKEEGDRQGEAYLKMMLAKQEGYNAFKVTHYKGDTYLRGITIPIIAKVEKKGVWIDYADLGPYEVILKTKDLIRGVSIPNMIPVRNTETKKRHYHHTATSSTGNVIDRPTNTCDSGFSHIFSEMSTTGDIPGLFNIYYIFLTRYDPRSPLPGCSTLPHERFL